MFHIQKNVDENGASQKWRRGRVYIPHGKGEEMPYKPHTHHIEVSYTECGPDNSSTIRWIPSHSSEETAFYPPLLRKRRFPEKANISTTREYTFYPTHGIPLVYGKGKMTFFNSVHRASLHASNEDTDTVKCQKRHVYGTRDGYPATYPGDKPYKIPEYSPSFHKIGSTRPVANFGGFKAETADTSIPLRTLPPIPAKPYSVLEAQRKKNVEINEIRCLEQWRPASPLIVPATDSK